MVLSNSERAKQWREKRKNDETYWEKERSRKRVDRGKRNADQRKRDRELSKIRQKKFRERRKEREKMEKKNRNGATNNEEEAVVVDSIQEDRNAVQSLEQSSAPVLLDFNGEHGTSQANLMDLLAPFGPGNLPGPVPTILTRNLSIKENEDSVNGNEDSNHWTIEDFEDSADMDEESYFIGNSDNTVKYSDNVDVHFEDSADIDEISNMIGDSNDKVRHSDNKAASLQTMDQEYVMRNMSRNDEESAMQNNYITLSDRASGKKTTKWIQQYEEREGRLLTYLTNGMTDRETYFERLQYELIQILVGDFDTIKARCREEQMKIEKLYPITRLPTVKPGKYQLDDVAASLYPEDAPKDHTPVWIYGDGNCLPRAGSIFAFDDSKFHIEIRVRIFIELCLWEECYCDDIFLNRGLTSPVSKIAEFFAQYADIYIDPVEDRNQAILGVFRSYTRSILQRNTSNSMWSLFGLSSVLGVKVFSIYPSYGGFNVRSHLHRFIMPRISRHSDTTIHIMWTNTTGTQQEALSWRPNHFVAVLPLEENCSSVHNPVPGTVIKSTDAGTQQTDTHLDDRSNSPFILQGHSVPTNHTHDQALPESVRLTDQPNLQIDAEGSLTTDSESLFPQEPLDLSFPVKEVEESLRVVKEDYQNLQNKETSPKEFCQDHPTTEVVYMCNICNIPVCYKCPLGQRHRHHDMSDLEILIENKQQEFFNKISEKHFGSLKSEIDKVSYAYEENMNNVKTAIDTRFNDCKRQLEKWRNSCYRQLLSNKDWIRDQVPLFVHSEKREFAAYRDNLQKDLNKLPIADRLSNMSACLPSTQLSLPVPQSQVAFQIGDDLCRQFGTITYDYSGSDSGSVQDASQKISEKDSALQGQQRNLELVSEKTTTIPSFQNSCTVRDTLVTENGSNLIQTEVEVVPNDTVGPDTAASSQAEKTAMDELATGSSILQDSSTCTSLTNLVDCDLHQENRVTGTEIRVNVPMNTSGQKFLGSKADTLYMCDCLEKRFVCIEKDTGRIVAESSDWHSITAVCLMQNEDSFLFGCLDRKIRKINMKTNFKTELFCLDYTPYSLCVINDEIFVSCQNKVTKYTFQGKHIEEHYLRHDVRLLRKCPKTHDLICAGQKFTLCDSSLNLKYCSDGKSVVFPDFTTVHTGRAVLTEQFCITFHGQGYILISTSDHIAMIDHETGQYIGKVWEFKTSMEVRDIHVDDDEILWVLFHDGFIKRIGHVSVPPSITDKIS